MPYFKDPTADDDERFTVEDDRPADWWMHDPVDTRRSRLGLDDPKSLSQQVGLTIATILVAVLVMALMFIILTAVEEKAPQGFRIAGKILFETAFAFFVLVVVYIWYKASWFRDVYLAVEKKFLLVCKLLVVSAFLVPVLAIIVARLR
ncbi:MAG: hypothetical protein IT428_23805 [Planctomycetaceae bacterium]|nr:hypothetical protein [Planctomycetaceae bacterium]